MEDKNKYEFQDWHLTDNNKGKTQSKPSGPLHTILIWALLLISLVIFAIGLVLVFKDNITDDVKALAVVTAVSLAGIGYIFFVATHTTKTPLKTLWLGIFFIVGAALVYFLPNMLAVSFRYVVGIIGVAIALLMFVNVWREHMDGVPWFGSLFWGLVYGAISIAILFTPDGTRVLSVMTGLYLIMIAGSTFFEALTALFHHKPNLKRNFVITLPMVISACFPMALFREVNEMVKEEPDELLYLQEPDSGKEPDLIVYIHSRAGLIPGMGHADLCWKDKVYAYGDYDEATWKMGGFVADGTMALYPPEKHIIMALKDEKKILMAYGLQLTPELKEKVQEKLDEIMSKAYRWEPNAELAAEGKISGNPDSFKDVGSDMYRQADAVFYKFKEGSPYKTYYAISENCSEVVNDVVGNTGLRLLKLNGVVTPGSYLEYLDELYLMEDTIVTDRRLYMLDENGRPVQYPLSPKEPIKLGNISM